MPSQRRLRVGVVGPGRLGRTLTLLLRRGGVQVDLRGRDDGWPENVDVILLTVPDHAIAAVAADYAGDAALLHCSGALDVDVLGPGTGRGSLHPLMTFPGPEDSVPDLAEVPAALAGDAVGRAAGERVAQALGLACFDVPGDRRLYHAAAVMAGNFATVLIAEASRVLVAAGVPPALAPQLLAPLAARSVLNAASGPARALTGPAARGDLEVLRAHRLALERAGLISSRELYNTLTERAERLKADTL